MFSLSVDDTEWCLDYPGISDDIEEIKKIRSSVVNGVKYCILAISWHPIIILKKTFFIFDLYSADVNRAKTH